MNLSTLELCLLAGCAGVALGVGASSLIEWFLRGGPKKSDGDEVARRLVPALEAFIEECAVVAINVRKSSRIALPRIAMPQLDLAEHDVSRRLSSELLGAVLELAFKVQASADALASNFNASNLPARGTPAFVDFFDMRRSQYSVLGLEAYELLGRIGTHCGHVPTLTAAEAMRSALDEIHGRRAAEHRKSEGMRIVMTLMLPDDPDLWEPPRPDATLQWIEKHLPHRTLSAAVTA